MRESGDVMRVLQAIAGAEHGGAETYFVDLVLALQRAGLEQHVVIRCNARRTAALHAGGVDPVELPFGGMFDWRTRRALRREIAAFKPDVVQTWMNRATRFCPRGNFIHVGWLGGYYKPENFRACDHAIGVTEDIVGHLVDHGWSPSRAHYLPTFASNAKASPVDRSEFGTPRGAPLVLALGRLHEKKAFDVLLKALARLPDAWLWLAGEGPLRGELEALASRLGVASRVRFLGWRNDRAALLAAADVCVMPSRYEPFGTVMIEAWAHRVPLVAAASAGPAGLIEDGETGLLVPVDDVEALAAAVERALADRTLAERLAAGGHAAYEERYTEAAVVRRYLGFFARVTA